MQLKRLVRRITGSEARERQATRRERVSVAPMSSSYRATDEELASMAGQAIVFRATVKHGGIVLPASVPLAFEDGLARGFFLAAGWADAVDRPPEQYWPAANIAIDPSTVSAATGRALMGG